MKKILFVVLLVLSSTQVRSQVLIALLFGEQLNTGAIEFGLDGGVNFASLGGIPDPKLQPLFNLGFYFDVKIGDPEWVLHTGVIVKSTMGTENAPVYQLHDETLDSLFIGGSVTTKLSYFNVPIMLKYRHPTRFFVEGGVMAGLLYNAYDNFIKTGENEEVLSYERQVKREYHPLDLGLMAGAGYKFFGNDGMILALRYYYGLIDVFIDDSGESKMNRSLYLSLGIPIGAQSKTEEEMK